MTCNRDPGHHESYRMMVIFKSQLLHIEFVCLFFIFNGQMEPLMIKIIIPLWV